jgi:hypothetical protein
MLEGPSVHREIDTRVRSARAEAQRVGQRLEALVAQLARATLERLRATRELAALRVQQLGAREFVEQLDGADRAALEHLEQRQSAGQELAARLAAARAGVEAAAAARAAALAGRDAADEALDALEHDVQARLRATADYQAAEAAASAALEHARNARAKAEARAKDREVKRAPFEKDRLFTYLWRRRYGSPNYASTGLVRALDGWVARLVRFDDARRTYHLLLTLADRLDEHADAQETLAAEAAAAQAELEERALLEAGAAPLREALARATAELDAADARLASAEQVLATVETDAARHAAGEDEHTSAAVAAVAERMRSETSAQLDREAASTAGAQDDVLVARLVAARVEVEGLEREVATLREVHTNATRVANELAEFERRFRSERYDSRESTFGQGLVLGVLLDGLVRGLLSSGRAFEDLGRHHRWRPRLHDDDFGRSLGRALGSPGKRSSPFSGLGGGIGASIGSSIGSSIAKSLGSGSRGGFGGGGFRSGGSFGGGGFKTGGRF